MAESQRKNNLLEIEDLIINMVRAEPSLYDKHDSRYHEQYKDRSSKFEVISSAIYQIFNEHWTEKMIEKKWEDMVKKYKEEYKKINKYHPSGSDAAKVQTSNWHLYSQMIFLEPHIQHRPSISSIENSDANLSIAAHDSQHPTSVASDSRMKDVTETPSLVNANRFKRKEIRNELDEIKSLIAQNKKAYDIFLKNEQEYITKENVSEILPQQSAVKKYIPLIRKGFGKITNEKKFDYCTDIIQYIQNFADNYKE